MDLTCGHARNAAGAAVHCCEGERPDQRPEQSQGAAPERASPVHAVDTTGNALLTNFPLLQWSLYSRL